MDDYNGYSVILYTYGIDDELMFDKHIDILCKNQQTRSISFIDLNVFLIFKKVKSYTMHSYQQILIIAPLFGILR